VKADLLARGRRQHAALGQVTAYRTLEILEGLGLARKLHQEELFGLCPSCRGKK
jgi:Fe2+ or Zn2+ uptake regulation protein